MARGPGLNWEPKPEAAGGGRKVGKCRKGPFSVSGVSRNPLPRLTPLAGSDSTPPRRSNRDRRLETGTSGAKRSPSGVKRDPFAPSVKGKVPPARGPSPFLDPKILPPGVLDASGEARRAGEEPQTAPTGAGSASVANGGVEGLCTTAAASRGAPRRDAPSRRGDGPTRAARSSARPVPRHGAPAEAGRRGRGQSES